MAKIERRLLIEEAIEDRETTEDIREYLGVSELGHPCDRYLWYRFRWFLKPAKIKGSLRRLFNRGHQEEKVVIKELKKVGVKVLSTQDRAVACHGHVQGHLDLVLTNIADAPKTKHLGEIKTSREKYFKELVKSDSAQKGFPSHYSQMQGYMHLFKLKRALYINTHKDSDNRYYERIKYNKQFCVNMFQRAEEIVISTIEPEPISTNPNFYRCGEKWCEFREICHNGYLGELNKTCRSCRNVEVHDKGRWFCGKKKKYLKKKAQIKGCKKWKYIATN